MPVRRCRRERAGPSSGVGGSASARVEHQPPADRRRRAGSRKSTASSPAFSSRSSVSSTIRSPRGPRFVDRVARPAAGRWRARPLRAIAHRSSRRRPGASQVRSLTREPRMRRPWKKRRRRSTGCARNGLDQAAGEVEQLPVGIGQVPVEPADRVVLGSRRCCCRPGVRPSSSPPSSIGTPWLSSSVASRLRCCRAALLEHGRVVGRALDAEVQRLVVVLAVAVVLAVGLVVLVLVADQVGQREAVVGGHEVDAGVRQPAALARRGRTSR